MSDSEKEIVDFVGAVQNKIRQELKERCEAYKPDFRNPEIFTVLTALIARQGTLATEMASAPQLWNGHSAPLFHRAMADVYITMSWIFLNPQENAIRYMEYGLGQAVLTLEHRKADLASNDEETKDMAEKIIDAEEAWINGQKLWFLIDVNVGSWSGKTTRTMAEEAGCLEFYNYVYIPFSQCAHSTWSHVGRYNSKLSDSPLTRQLWIPQIADSASDIWNLHLTIRYLDKTFNLFDEKALLRGPTSDVHG